MWDILYYLLVMAFLAGTLVAGGLLARGYLDGSLPMLSLMGGPRPEPRLDVVEQASVDGKRRLLLIRRDEVEHLIMTGGPVDMVIETGIGQTPRRTLAAEVAEPPVYSRQPRRFGAAVEG